jgi:putative hydrolase
MSELPGEGGDFFSRIPLFREFARLLSGEPGPVNWELARQVAVATAIGAETLGGPPALPFPKFSPEPGEQRVWGDNLRLAELWIDPVSSLPGPDRPLSAQLVSRPDWAESVLRGFAPLVEPPARRMAEAIGPGAGAGLPPEMAQLVGRLGGLLAGLQVGTMVGQLSHLVLSQYDLPLPPRDPGGIVLLGETLRAFEESSGLPRDQLRLWLACHAVVGHRLLAGVAWLPEHLQRLVEEMARLTEPDASGLMDRLQALDMSSPESVQELLEGGQSLTGPPSAELRAATGRLEVVLALIGGYALALCGRVLAGRLPALASIEAEIHRRMADEGGAHALFAQLLRVDPQEAGAARGERFCQEVLAATDVDGLDQVWAHPDFLPTPEELAVPGRWLERVGLVGGAEVSLDEGLRALLEGEEGAEPGTGKGAPGEGSPGEPGTGEGAPGEPGGTGEPGGAGDSRD